MDKETRQKVNISRVQGLQPSTGHENYGGTVPQQTQKFTKWRSTAINKIYKRKNVCKTKIKDVQRWQSTKVLHT